METVLRSHVGYARQLNEDHGDYLHYDSGWVLAVVADGMGGHRAGDVASKMAVQVVKREMAEIESTLSQEDVCEKLKQAISSANEEVFLYSLENEECRGMGTTIVTALATPEWVVIAHIGDSRIYKKSSHQLLLLTQDHSLVNELQRKGQLTEEEANVHPQRNVLMRALGTDRHVDVDVSVICWEEQDMLLLCSDGLSNMVVHEELNKILHDNFNIESQADALIEKALEAGGDDNVTVILVRNQGSSERQGGANH